MSVFVVDASLVVKWFVPEVHSVAARRWLDASHDYIAPDLVFPEASNAIWKSYFNRATKPRTSRFVSVNEPKPTLTFSSSNTDPKR